MRITILAFGTRGDVQPMLALGKGLARKGHQVCIAAGANFERWIEAQGLEAASGTVDMQAVMESEVAEEWLQHGTNPIVNARVMRRLFLQHGRALMQDAWNASQGAQVVVSSMLSEVYAVSIADKLGAQHIRAWLQPSMIATRSGPATLNAPLPNRSSRINYWFTKVLVEPFQWNLCGDITNRFREEVLELPPQTRAENTAARRKTLVLHGYSRFVIPHPADWPPNIHTTGYWLLDQAQEWQPPRELAAFLEAGSPPICIGFGSMAGQDAGALADLFVRAVEQSHVRAIWLSGWTGAGGTALPDSILRMDSAPHEWLFPRVQAVVHHGGAGTTAASLRAGIPAIVTPHLADQMFWAHRVHALGVGPKGIPREELTTASLAAAIAQATSDGAMKQRAAELGARIRGEDGVARAVELIEEDLRGN